MPNVNKDKAYEIRNKIFDKLFKVRIQVCATFRIIFSFNS